MTKIKLQHEHWYRCANGAVYQVIADGNLFKRMTGIPHDSVNWDAEGTPNHFLARAELFEIVEEVIVTPAPKPVTLFVGFNLYKGGHHVKLGHFPGAAHLQATRVEVLHSLGCAGHENSDWVASSIMEVTVGDFAGVKPNG